MRSEKAYNAEEEHRRNKRGKEQGEKNEEKSHAEQLWLEYCSKRKKQYAACKEYGQRSLALDTNTTGGMTRRCSGPLKPEARARFPAAKIRDQLQALSFKNRTASPTMSARLLRRPAGQLLARSHASPNASGVRPPTRAFHASAPRQDPVLDAILYLPHEMMTLIHSQVPWYAAIPASAFLLRAALVTSFGTWARSLMARYIGLQPLRQALAYQKRDEVMKSMYKAGGVRTPKEATRRTMQGVKVAVRELDSRWKVTLKGQIGWTLVQIPIFFTMAEVIRKMCGARDGLLALTTSSIKGIKDKITGGAAATTDAPAVTDAAAVPDAAWTPDALSVASAYNNTTSAANVDDLAAISTSPFFEPSLANEGMLWFTDLTMPDPFLPFIVSGLMFSNIYFTKNAPTDTRNWSNAVRRVLLGVSLLIGPLCQNLPAGLMLYWAGSTSSVMFWNKWLDWKYPAPRDFTACKRPLQIPPTIRTKAQIKRI